MVLWHRSSGPSSECIGERVSPPSLSQSIAHCPFSSILSAVSLLSESSPESREEGETAPVPIDPSYDKYIQAFYDTTYRSPSLSLVGSSLISLHSAHVIRCLVGALRWISSQLLPSHFLRPLPCLRPLPAQVIWVDLRSFCCPRHRHNPLRVVVNLLKVSRTSLSPPPPSLLLLNRLTTIDLPSLR
jgi:hypothetical protein